MTYNKLKELVGSMLVRDTFDEDKIPDILQKVVRYGDKEKLALLIDLLSCDIVYGTGYNAGDIAYEIAGIIKDAVPGIFGVLCFVARNVDNIPAAVEILDYFNSFGITVKQAEPIMEAIDFYKKMSRYGFQPHDTFWTYKESISANLIARELKIYADVINGRSTLCPEHDALNYVYRSICKCYPDVTMETAAQYLLDHTEGAFHAKVAAAQERMSSGGNTEEVKNIVKVLGSSAPELLKWAMLKQYFMTNHPELNGITILKRMKPMLREQDFAHLGMLLLSTNLPKQESEVPALAEEWLRRFPSALVTTLDKYDKLYLCYELTTRLLPF